MSIQWDICQEVLVFENYFPTRPPDYKERIAALLGRLGDAVPPGVELGYHLCYGSPADQHLVMPKDTTILTEIANAIFARVQRSVDFLHLPVPRERDDSGYVMPLHSLRLPPPTQLYLGLIHHADAAGDRRRIAAARTVTPRFGVADRVRVGPDRSRARQRSAGESPPRRAVPHEDRLRPALRRRLRAAITCPSSGISAAPPRAVKGRSRSRAPSRMRA